MIKLILRNIFFYFYLLVNLIPEFLLIGCTLFTRLQLLIELDLDKNKNSNKYIIAPDDEKRNNLEKYSGRYFTFFFKKLKRNYIRQLKHLRQTYITREDLFINGRVSMQHSNYKTTLKHYSNRREVAKWMVENGFRIFPERK